MRDWEARRANEISENILVAHIVSLLIFVMILFSFYSTPFLLSDRISYLFSIVLFLFCAVTILYVARKLLARFTFMDQPRIDEVLLLAITLPVTFAFLWYSEGFVSAKILVIVPAIITAIAFGKVIGIGEAALTCSLLFLIDYLLHGGVPSEALQANLIIAGITVLMAWLVGGLIEVERGTQRELARLADYDTLSGLINYRYFQERLAASLRQADADKSTLSLALLDIDQFKYFNAVYGYQKGDEILKTIGKLLRDEIGEPFYAARYGGDEFMLVLPGLDKDAARRIAGETAGKILTQVNSMLLESCTSASWKDFTISIGAVGYPEGGNEVRPLIRAAENDLFRVKYSEADYMYQSVVSEIGTLQIKDAFPTLQTFVALINSKDKYTYGHSERVISYSLALADRICLTEDEKDLLRFSAYLHDIGKIEIETGILNKTEDLEPEEWKSMMSHPVRGSEMLKPMVSFLPVVPIIRAHHENYDGSGYPDGRRGEDIPLMSRIIRIADSFDAMTNNRPYRKAMTPSETFAELRKLSGVWYDPILVHEFLGIIKDIYQPVYR